MISETALAAQSFQRHIIIAADLSDQSWRALCYAANEVYRAGDLFHVRTWRAVPCRLHSQAPCSQCCTALASISLGWPLGSVALNTAPGRLLAALNVYALSLPSCAVGARQQVSSAPAHHTAQLSRYVSVCTASLRTKPQTHQSGLYVPALRTQNNSRVCLAGATYDIPLLKPFDEQAHTKEIKDVIKSR